MDDKQNKRFPRRLPGFGFCCESCGEELTFDEFPKHINVHCPNQHPIRDRRLRLFTDLYGKRVKRVEPKRYPQTIGTFLTCPECRHNITVTEIAPAHVKATCGIGCRVNDYMASIVRGMYDASVVDTPFNYNGRNV